MIIKTGEGKYETTVTGDGRISVRRNGYDWRNETGDGYIYSLLSRIDELQDLLAATTRRLNLPARDLLPGDVVLRHGAGSDKTLHSLTQRGIGGVLAQWTCGGSSPYSEETVLEVVRGRTPQTPVAWTDENGLYLLKEMEGITVQPTQERGGSIGLYAVSQPAPLPIGTVEHFDFTGKIGDVPVDPAD